MSTQHTTTETTLAPISPAQLAANRANAALSTGPRTEEGRARSSQNAVKSALTGQTVLLPSDSREEYATLIAEFQKQYRPEGTVESELVQIIVDCHWRLRRIQTMEHAYYVHGERQFAGLFKDMDPLDAHSMMLVQISQTYGKELRNLHIQEARIDRKRASALKELRALQEERKNAEPAEAPAELDDDNPHAPFKTDREFMAAFAAGYIPPTIAARLKQRRDQEGA